jgi:hypothetical protein
VTGVLTSECEGATIEDGIGVVRLAAPHAAKSAAQSDAATRPNKIFILRSSKKITS